jgi:hypothetical protein
LYLFLNDCRLALCEFLGGKHAECWRRLKLLAHAQSSGIKAALCS